MKKKLLSLLLSLTMILGCIPSFGTTALAAESGSAELRDIILDKVSVLYQKENPDVHKFSPEITNYTGTAYYSVNSVKVFPFAVDSNATITVNGTTVTDNSVDVPLSMGVNTINVGVTNGENSKNYTVEINKVGTDFRGRRPMSNNEFTISTDFGGDVNAMVDGNGSTYWSPDATPVNEENGTPTSFIIDLKQVRPVSRISMDYAQNYALWNNMVRISVSEDGETWTPVIQKGNMREDQGIVRYEFGISYDARYVKYEVIKFNAASLKINEFTIFEDPENHMVEQDPPEGGDQPFVPTNDNISRGQEIVIEKGFPVSGWMPSGQYGRGVPTPEESNILGWDGPLFYDPPLENVQYMKYNPNSLWGLAKAPWGSNGMGQAGTPRDFVDEGMLPYINNAVSFCFGDEGGYSYAEALRFKEWFDFSKEKYPGTIVHSNQVTNGWSRANYEEYMRVSQPDMLTWDTYYNWSDSNAWNAPYSMLNTTAWNLLREMSLKGIDGTGQKPILYGQYLDVYNRDQPMSQKNLVVNLSLLTGMKWLNYFRVEFQFDHCYLWDEDGTPSRGSYEWGEVNRYLKTIDDYILRLNSDWVVSKPGKHLSDSQEVTNNVKNAWKMGGFDQNADVNTGYYIQDVSAQNISQANNGLPGDVLLGYFNALPGLPEAEVKDTFGSTAPKAFMVLNGLSAGTSGGYTNPNVVGKERGSAENTQQTITLTFTGEQTAPLKKVNRNTGVVEDVEIVNNTLTITLGGGEAELYFWAEDSSSSASSEVEGHEAANAFDGYSDTYWQAAEDATLPIELTTEFTPKSIDKLIINEQGEAITGYKLQYLVNGKWQDVPNGAGETIGLSKVVNFNPILVSGLKLIITSANGQVGIKDIRAYSTTTTHTLDINDNDLGTAVNRISFEGDWFYRETDLGDLTTQIGNDFHASKWLGSSATVTFYGNKIEFFGRKNANTGKATVILDGNEDNPYTMDETTGADGFHSFLTIENLENGVHTAKITYDTARTGSAYPQFILDGARVSYNGDLPANPEGSTEQIYVNDTQINTENENHFVFDGQYGANVNTADGWKIYAQTMNDNSGYTHTTKVDAFYELNFYGTDVSIFSSKKAIGEAEFYLDGELVEGGFVKDGNTDTNALCVKTISTGAAENGEHVLKVVTKSGTNRIDYAVVTKLADTSGGSTEITYTITAAAGSNGSITPATLNVKEHEDAVFTITPDEGFAIDSVTVNGSVAKLEGNHLVIYNVTENKNVRATFIIKRPDVIDRNALQTLVDGILELQRFDYTGGTWREIQITLPAAQQVLAQEDATDEQINTAFNDLWDAKLALIRLAEGRPIPEEDPPRKLFVDNTDPAITYGGTWSGNGSGSGADETYLQSQQWVGGTNNSTITMNFTGTGIQVIQSRHPSGGTMTVEINDQSGNVVVSQSDINYQGDKALRQVVYEKLDLPYGTYTVKVSYNNGQYAEFDGFFIYNEGQSETDYTVTFAKTPADATIVVKDAQGTVINAEDDGSYLLAAGNYTYTASAPEYITQEDVAFTVAGDMEIPVVLEKEPVEEQYTVTFKLSPKYAVITVKDAQGNIVEAQKDGSYLLKAGAYTYSAVAGDHIAQNNVAFNVTQNAEISVTLVDIRYLTITVAYAEQQSTEGVVESVKQQFEAALKAAQDILVNPNATQEQVDAADEELIRLLQYLEFKGDPTSLNALIKEAEEINLNLYLDGDVKNAFQQALAEAKDTVENYPLTAELAQAEAKLKEAMEALESVRIDEIDLSKLQSVVNAAKSMYDGLDKYIDNAKKTAFKDAYEQAIDLLANPTTQEAVDAAATALHSAMLELRLKPNKDALLELIQRTEQIDLNLYTEATAQVVRETLAAAQAVMNNPQATQEDVDGAQKALKAAVDNLQKKSEGGSSSGGDGSSATGDSFPYLVMFVTFTALLAVLVLARKRQRHE